MTNKLRFNFPEIKLYWIVIAVYCGIITYYDRYIGIFSIILSIYLIYYNSRIMKYKNNDFLIDLKNLSIDMDEITKQTMLNFPVAFCIINNSGKIQWNNSKLSLTLSNDNLIDTDISDILDVDLAKKLSESTDVFFEYKDYIINERHYKIQVIDISKKQKIKKYAVYFFDVNEEFNILEQYNNIKPVITFIQVDNFDEVLNSSADDFKPLLEADIERRIRYWLERKDGIFTKLSKDKYFCIFHEPMLKVAEEEKFNVLDDLREIEMSNTIPVTLSIGVSTYEKSLINTYKNAIAALDMALGRGGDQAVCKLHERTIFYGGKTKSVEKRTRVRARIVGRSMRDLFEKADNILIMGHTYPDLDSLGSCMGVYEIAQVLNKEAKVILEKSNKSIETLFNKIRKTDGYENIFISHYEADSLINNNTVLVVVDTHKASISEYPALVEKIDNIMMIDHHRRGMEFLDKANLIYHETYVSSASEMVTELIQYVEDDAKIDTITAESLLAGITLDTKNFAFKTGVRTFEAAAFLRKNGADPIEVKKLFQGDYESFLLRANCIQNAKIIEEKVAISSYGQKVANPSLTASQIADELLNIRGVQASFVIIEGLNEVIQVSARSLEKINVQVIMEMLGGGGHIDMAATQIKNSTLEEAITMVEEAVEKYFNDEKN